MICTRMKNQHKTQVEGGGIERDTQSKRREERQRTKRDEQRSGREKEERDVPEGLFAGVGIGRRVGLHFVSHLFLLDLHHLHHTVEVVVA